MGLKVIFNPIEGELDLVPIQDKVDSAAKVQEEFDLDGAASVGDLIIPSTTLVETVQAITTNYNYPSAAFGVITGFVTPTRVTVLISGKLAGSTYQLAGLQFGRVLFVGSDGKLTTTPPAAGPLQKFGIALKSDTVFLLPSLDIINRA